MAQFLIYLLVRNPGFAAFGDAALQLKLQWKDGISVSATLNISSTHQRRELPNQDLQSIFSAAQVSVALNDTSYLFTGLFRQSAARQQLKSGSISPSIST